MFNIFLRAVIFGLGVEIGRDVYRAVKRKTIAHDVGRRPDQPNTDTPLDEERTPPDPDVPDGPEDDESEESPAQ